MVISFDDSNTKTSSMHLVRVFISSIMDLTIRNQGIDLGKLEEVHTLYKASTDITRLIAGRYPRRRGC
jgi:hypothetical protein